MKILAEKVKYWHYMRNQTKCRKTQIYRNETKNTVKETCLV